MEFEGHEEHEDEEEEEEEEEEEMGLQMSYDSLGNSQRVIMGTSSGVQTTTTTTETTQLQAKYRECLKNHAVGIGRHAVDGCGEFMPAGPDGTLDALKCAACKCHRNFHRKEFNNNNNNPPPPLPPPPPADVYFHGGRHHIQVPQFTPYYRTPGGYVHIGPPQQRLLALPSTSGGGQSREEQDDVSNPGGGGGSSAAARKRFRTKFSQEQKERMLGLAERLGWRMQKHDEALVQQFCNETGVRRHVLKVWMHNNKHTLGKKP